MGKIEKEMSKINFLKVWRFMMNSYSDFALSQMNAAPVPICWICEIKPWFILQLHVVIDFGVNKTLTPIYD